MFLLPPVVHSHGRFLLAAVARFLGVGLATLTTALAFPPNSIPAMAILGFALFLASLYLARPVSALLLSFGYGVGLVMIVQAWSVPIALGRWLEAAFITGVSFAVFGITAAYLMRYRLWPLSVAAAFGATDYVLALLSNPIAGTSRLVYSQADTVLFLPVSVLGASSVAFLIAIVAGLLAYIGWLIALRDHTIWLLLLSAGLTVLLLSAGALFTSQPPSADEPTVKVLTVQAGWERRLARDAELKKVPDELAICLQWLRSYASQYSSGAAMKPDLVVLPPALVSLDSLSDPDVIAALTRTSRILGAPILFGYVEEQEGKRDNALYSLWGKAGEVARVDLGPRGEGAEADVPFALLEVGGTTVGLMEIGQSYASPHELVGAGEANIVISFHPALPEGLDRKLGSSRLVSARLVAAAAGKPLVVVSQVGPSGFVSPSGELDSWATYGRSGLLFSRTNAVPAAPLPERRDSLLLLAFLLLPAIGVVLTRNNTRANASEVRSRLSATSRHDLPHPPPSSRRS